MTERVLAIDYGERRVGMAISDPETDFVSGLPTLDRRALKGGGLTAAIAALVAERGVERILLGIPYSLDGSIGPAAERVLAFRDRLHLTADVPVDEWDERLTTEAAKRRLEELGEAYLAADRAARPGRPGPPAPGRRWPPLPPLPSTAARCSWRATFIALRPSNSSRCSRKKFN